MMLLCLCAFRSVLITDNTFKGVPILAAMYSEAVSRSEPCHVNLHCVIPNFAKKKLDPGAIPLSLSLCFSSSNLLHAHSGPWGVENLHPLSTDMHALSHPLLGSAVLVSNPQCALLINESGCLGEVSCVIFLPLSEPHPATLCGTVSAAFSWAAAIYTATDLLVTECV